MGLFDSMLRRARIRGVKEGQVQTARAEALENDVKDEAERWQDYGFACNAVDGQGLVINVGGHTLVIRMDRIADRPRLDAYEVSVWHKEGHRVTLKAGKLVQVDCDSLVINASVGVVINSPLVEASGEVAAGVAMSAPTMGATASLTVAGVEVGEHVHGGVSRGSEQSDPLS